MKFLGLICLLALSACSLKPIRGEYKIQKSGDLITTTSPLIFDRALGKPEPTSDSIRNMDFIVENISTKDSYTLVLSNAEYLVNGAKTSVSCSALTQKDTGTLVLAPTSRFRVNCQFLLVATPMNLLDKRDSEGTIHVPVTGQPGLFISYLTRIEEFER